MTDPAGGPPAPTPPDQGSWQSPPPQTTPPSQFAKPMAAGPAPGVAYADLVTRIIAYIIDSVVLAIITFVIAAIIGVAILGALLTGGFVLAIIGAVILAMGALFASAIYFVYTWTTLRASPGMKVLNLEVVNAADGATLTRDQAIRRWAWLFGPQVVASVGQFALGQTDISWLGSVLGLLSLVYVIYLLYTAAQSPKRQGFHDVQAATVVVKRLS
jgi:uncharacterized RDD family membrane protein YckC